MEYLYSNILSVLVCLIFLSGCNVNNSDDIQQYYQKFNGTWHPVRSVSEKPIDADLDGDASRFMLTEITDWEDGFLEIRIIKDSSLGPDYPHLVSVPYPIQSFPPESNPGEPGFFVNYLINTTGWAFRFNQTQDSLIIEHESTSGIDGDKYPYPESVTVDNENLIIEVVIEKKLYTADGWQTVKITTRYARIYKGT